MDESWNFFSFLYYSLSWYSGLKCKIQQYNTLTDIDIGLMIAATATHLNKST